MGGRTSKENTKNADGPMLGAAMKPALKVITVYREEYLRTILVSESIKLFLTASKICINTVILDAIQQNGHLEEIYARTQTRHWNVRSRVCDQRQTHWTAIRGEISA